MESDHGECEIFNLSTFKDKSKVISIFLESLTALNCNVEKYALIKPIFINFKSDLTNTMFEYIEHDIGNFNYISDYLSFINTHNPQMLVWTIINVLNCKINGIKKLLENDFMDDFNIHALVDVWNDYNNFVMKIEKILKNFCPVLVQKINNQLNGSIRIGTNISYVKYFSTLLFYNKIYYAEYNIKGNLQKIYKLSKDEFIKHIDIHNVVDLIDFIYFIILLNDVLASETNNLSIIIEKKLINELLNSDNILFYIMYNIHQKIKKLNSNCFELNGNKLNEKNREYYVFTEINKIFLLIKLISENCNKNAVYKYYTILLKNRLIEEITQPVNLINQVNHSDSTNTIKSVEQDILTKISIAKIFDEYAINHMHYIVNEIKIVNRLNEGLHKTNFSLSTDVLKMLYNLYGNTNGFLFTSALLTKIKLSNENNIHYEINEHDIFTEWIKMLKLIKPIVINPKLWEITNVFDCKIKLPFILELYFEMLNRYYKNKLDIINHNKTANIEKYIQWNYYIGYAYLNFQYINDGEYLSCKLKVNTLQLIVLMIMQENKNVNKKNIYNWCNIELLIEKYNFPPLIAHVTIQSILHNSVIVKYKNTKYYIINKNFPFEYNKNGIVDLYSSFIYFLNQDAKSFDIQNNVIRNNILSILNKIDNANYKKLDTDSTTNLFKNSMNKFVKQYDDNNQLNDNENNNNQLGDDNYKKSNINDTKVVTLI
jgi:hypothetical protein